MFVSGVVFDAEKKHTRPNPERGQEVRDYYLIEMKDESAGKLVVACFVTNGMPMPQLGQKISAEITGIQSWAWQNKAVVRLVTDDSKCQVGD